MKRLVQHYPDNHDYKTVLADVQKKMGGKSDRYSNLSIYHFNQLYVYIRVE